MGLLLFFFQQVTSEENVEETLKLTTKHFGQLNNIVNCAGIGIARKVYNVSKQIPHAQVDFLKLLEVSINLTPPSSRSRSLYSIKYTVFTISIRTPQLLTIYVLKFEPVQFTTRCCV